MWGLPFATSQRGYGRSIKSATLIREPTGIGNRQLPDKIMTIDDTTTHILFLESRYGDLFNSMLHFAA